ncbi:unnamed protein product [Caenorhabditis sp. 36 PRJEB53466]|nr:unnamed protein product [Caenorhabditis sp. 36 PRJEB53466]
MMTWKSIFVLVASISLAMCQLKEDRSLREACTHMEGVFTQRADGEKSTTGDTCEMKFQVATHDELDANEFCKIYAPWRLLKATHGKETVCFVEATMMCKPGWVQMFGYCYWMPRKSERFTLAEAQKKCNSENAHTARMTRRYIVGVWRRYFKGISQIWVRATAAWDQYVQLEAGDALALAFTGKHYNFSVAANSLIRIDPSIKLQVLCEYRPRPTAAEITYLARRYAEIYHPGAPLDNGVLIRTASHYARGTSYENVCRRVLVPFTRSQKTRQKRSLTNHAKLSPFAGDNIPHDLTFSRAIAEVLLDAKQMRDPKCSELLPTQFRLNISNARVPVKFQKPEPRASCDNVRSTAITHFPDTHPSLRAMSDSRAAPIWCQLNIERNYTNTIPKGYYPFKRGNGLTVIHRIVREEKTWEEAQKTCMESGDRISGFDSIEELEHLKEMCKKAGLPENTALWLGSQRKQACKHMIGFSNDLKSPCARGVVMEWLENVARNPIRDDMWMNGRFVNPDYSEKGQDCMTFNHGKMEWSGTDVGYLDDISCSSKIIFFCGRYVEQKDKNDL